MSHAGEPAAPARLLGLRLHGFKSFADRTTVEFGAGISAVVGPNGSGKSNLADALRWALGEQGRSLRTRKSEDVIFAGSERRAALGMADVTLVLDNADGLLPVDYQVVELGRRLYRSGENDYLLNRQRVRLRDLVDLLDAAHLADNAFLFIGQGMVDQALALRPEERRPLFEEVAGVRRHERRRRRAEEQLQEAEANLARIDDILGELRPQARRLAAQAEQQATRETAGEDLATALVLAAHARWHEGATKSRQSADRLASARREADAALTGLQGAERTAVAIATELAGRAAVERVAREAHEDARSSLTALQLRAERLGSELAAIVRDRERLEGERAAAEAAISAWRRELAQPVPSRDVDLETALAEAERAVADALLELGTARSARAARGEALAAVRRAEAARQAEAEGARRRLADAERRVEDERRVAIEADAGRAAAERESLATEAVLRTAVEAERAATARRDELHARLETLDGVRRAADERAASIASRFAAMRGRLEAVTARLAEEETRGIAKAARRQGGRRLDEDLEVEPSLRAAADAALGEALRAYVVAPGAVDVLAAERGMLAIESAAAGVPAENAAGRSQRPLLERVSALGGGRLADGVRRDRSGLARRLLDQCVWVPDLAAALDVQPLLPPGWLAVTRSGDAVVRPVTVALGRPDSILERRAEAAALAAGVDAVRVELEAADADRSAASEAAAAARAGYDAARDAEQAATAERRRAEEAHRAATRDGERTAREAAWHAAQLERLEADRERLRGAIALAAGDGAGAGQLAVGAAPGASETGDTGAATAERPPERADGDDASALAALDARADDLRRRRDRLAAQYTDAESRRQEAERRRTRAEASVSLDEDRLARADRDSAALSGHEQAIVAERDRLGEDLALAAAREDQARRELASLQAADAADRSRMAEADAATSHARDRLRSAEERLRAAEVGDLEARLALESIREQILVELAGLGDLGLRTLFAAISRMADARLDGDGAVPVGLAAGSRESSDGIEPVVGATDDEAAALERAIGAIAPFWESMPPPAEPPGPARLAVLRRRYHELGAANPFAVEEYAAVRTRLESLEAQRDDLRSAIARTRTLIEDLDRMISEQFRATFSALEVAFDLRFRQLFGGGFARLSLTEPSDLTATGIEIVARPPGKKAQALAMLSGGERALTAVALLFAMLEVRPVPFCVLDEVDAALDEANVGRFTEALRGLAARTQFVVITHNRGTIEAADALYGVTVGDDSVSRVISLRLEEATALAATAEAEAEPVAG